MTKVLEDTVALDIVARSQPKIGRPRSREATEQRLAETDQKSARCYAEIELFTERFNTLAKELGSNAGERDDGVPEPGLLFEDISTVHHVENVRSQLRALDENAPPQDDPPPQDGDDR